MIKNYLRSRLKYFTSIIIMSAIFLVVFFVENTNISSALYGFLISSAFFICYTVIDFFIFKKKLNTLKYVKNNLTTFDTISLNPISEVERNYCSIISEYSELYKNLSHKSHSEKSDMIDFYTLWVHQVKTPIFALKLLSKDNINSSELSSEITKIENYSDMVLNYAKLSSTTTELNIKKENAKPIVNELVKSFSQIFISKKLKLNLFLEDTTVYTDKKWLKFTLSQILSNSLKYTEKGCITITLKNNIICIKDSGIGISEEDLPRIFERGYTGFNGRHFDKSTGIGLYLCKKSAELLNLKLKIDSKKGEGTAAYIDLSQSTRLYD